MDSPLCIKNDKEVVKKAIQQCPLALKYASEELRDNLDNNFAWSGRLRAHRSRKRKFDNSDWLGWWRWWDWLRWLDSV